MRKSTTQLLKTLRQLMAKEKISAYIVPSGDAHNSEYLADADERRAFISGFTGSNGTAVVTTKEAALWTDGRYFLQAESQLDENWTLMRDGVKGTPTRGEWLADKLEAGQAVGVDPYLVPCPEWDTLEGALRAGEVVLQPVSDNLVDRVWGADQPDRPENPVLPLEDSFTGRSWEDKVSAAREAMREKRANCLVLSALDEVAWMLNLRGSDIAYNPVFFAYLMVTSSSVYLFVSDKQVSDAVKKHLRGKVNVHVRQYSDVSAEVDKYAAENTDKKIWFAKGTSKGLASLVPTKQSVSAPSPVAVMKAVKNATELQGFKKSHIRDAAALCAYFAWLEKNVHNGTVTEISGADKLEQLRSEMDHFVGLSFPTISASGPNGAIIHYRPSQETCRTLTTDEVYLCDSGAQYKDGTTDVTRTLHFGAPTAHQRRCFTRVLKGQLRLRLAVFPAGATGNRLDSFARAALWQAGLDYMHGTGHGVGSYLNVHEGPSGISMRPMPDDPGLQEGMVFSDEPGYYEDGAFGIRLENLLYTVKADTEFNFGDRGYLTFADLTLVPIQRRMIDPELLTAEEVSFLDEYHSACREQVGKVLRERGMQDGLNWLMKETEPIG